MTRPPLHVMILWHMHQPFYRNIENHEYRMPWVLLHGVKDYLDMPLLGAEYPNLRMTFNMTPVLLEQLEDYAAGRARDPYLELASRPTAQLSTEEKLRLLETFFNANETHLIAPHARYRELRELLGSARDRHDLRGVVGRFNEADLRDLQVWFFLAWIDPYHVRRDKRLQRLVRKDRFFSEADKAELLEICRKLVARVIPTLRELSGQGRIELSTSAFHHPILPLLIDTEIARRPDPRIALPNRRFRQPGDARRQIEQGLAFSESRFGRRPTGLWPSEGAVCPELIPLLAEAGVRWTASDEGILARSLGKEGFRRDDKGRLTEPDLLYRPWRVEHGGGSAALFFRDRMLSDLIGFHYANIPAAEAVDDLIGHLDNIDRSLEPFEGPHVVSLILDGENCWEYYPNDGEDFLRGLYEALTRHPRLETVTPSQYLEQTAQPRGLDKLASGSWINQDFSIWIGRPEKNTSWDLLAETREALGPCLGKDDGNGDGDRRPGIARKALDVAEGSDWNWWYGEPNSTSFDAQFDALYRQHLASAWYGAGFDPPGRIHLPVADPGLLDLLARPRAFITPRLDGRITDYFEWFSAGHYDPGRAGDSMHRAHSQLLAFYYGFDRERFWLRIDPTPDLLDTASRVPAELALLLVARENHRVMLPLQPGAQPHGLHLREDGEAGWIEVGPFLDYACLEIIEVGLPMKTFGIEPGGTLAFQIAVHLDNVEVERSPMRTPLETAVPDVDFEECMWIV